MATAIMQIFEAGRTLIPHYHLTSNLCPLMLADLILYHYMKNGPIPLWLVPSMNCSESLNVPIPKEFTLSS